MNKTDLWDAINHYCVACGGSPATRVYGNGERQRAVVSVEKAVCETTEAAMDALKVRLQRTQAALGHVVEVLEALADRECSGHEGDDETGEHFDDCMRCKVEAALAHAEDGCRS